MLCACALHLALPAAERKPFPQELEERLARLVKQLGDERFEARDAANQEILNFGRRVRAPLEKFREDGDPEISARVACIIAESKAGAEGDPTDFGLQWLARAQCADGHWNSVKHGSKKNSDIEHTALALLAFLGAGQTEKIGSYKDNVRWAAAWLRQRQRADGAIVLPGDKEVDGVAHALAAMALCEAAGMANKPETKAAAQRAVEYSIQVHQGVTGFARQARSATPDLFTTTLFIMHLRSAKIARLSVRPEAFEKAIQFLDQVDDTKSAFRNSPDENPSLRSTLMGTLSRQFMGWKKEELAPYTEAIAKEFVPQVEGPSADLLANFIVSMVLFQDWEAYEKYQKLLTAGLRAAQRDDDEFDGSWDPAGECFGGGRVEATALCALCRVCRGYRPMK